MSHPPPVGVTGATGGLGRRVARLLRSSQYLEYVPLSVSPEGVLAGPAGDGRIA